MLAWLRWVVATFVMALVFPIMLGKMGATAFGFWAALTAPTNLTALFGLGVSSAVISIVGRSLGAARKASGEEAAAEDLGAAGSCAKAGLLVSAAAGLLAVIVGYFAAGWLVPILGISGADASGATWLFRASSACLGGMLLGSGITAVLDATGRVDLESIALAVVSVSNALLLLAAVLIHPTFTSLALVSLATAVLNVAVPAGFFFASGHASLLGWGALDRRAFRALAHLAVNFGLVGALGTLIDPAVKWTIAALGGGAPVAAYELAARIMLLVVGSFSAVITPLVPHYAAVFATSGARMVGQSVGAAARLLTAISLPGVTLFAAAASAVLRLWLGGDVPRGAVASVYILAVSSAVNLWLRPAWGALVASGQGRTVLLAQIVTVAGVAALLGLTVAGVVPSSTAAATTVAVGGVLGGIATYILYSRKFGPEARSGLARAPLRGLLLSLTAVAVVVASLAGAGDGLQVLLAGALYGAVIAYLLRKEPALRRLAGTLWSKITARSGSDDEKTAA